MSSRVHSATRTDGKKPDGKKPDGMDGWMGVGSTCHIMSYLLSVKDALGGGGGQSSECGPDCAYGFLFILSNICKASRT